MKEICVFLRLVVDQTNKPHAREFGQDLVERRELLNMAGAEARVNSRWVISPRCSGTQHPGPHG
eukprot:6628183-Prorocentrum_lima.AAC.1